MSSIESKPKKVIYGLDPEKYPTNMGKQWLDEEVVQLLRFVKAKKSVNEIAEIHQRTEGGIYCKLRDIAADYHFNNKLSMEEIQRHTGLGPAVIQDAISKREIKDSMPKKGKRATPLPETPDMKDMLTILLDIQQKLNFLLDQHEMGETIF